MKLAKGLSLSDKGKVMKNWLSRVIREEVGQALPTVLAMLALGSLVIVPVLNLVSTSLNAGETVEEKVEGLYAADAGVEDAFWKLKYNKPASFPYSYQLPADVNGMSVSIVIEYPDTLFDYEVDLPGQHVEWLQVIKSVSYNAELGIYFYIMYLENTCTSNIKIEMIVLDFPPDLEYREWSTGGDITTDNPDVNGDPDKGITLSWELSPPYPNISAGETAVHTFELDGPPDVEGVEGHGFVRARRMDVGEVWDSESTYPYRITAEAKDADDAVVATIVAGVWLGSDNELTISCWEINP